MNWHEARTKLAADKGQWSHISRETGLHINAVRNIALGLTPNPRIDTVELIVAYYDRASPTRGAQAD